MKLGAFSLSLAVKDLTRSKTFYEKLGFTVFAGEETRGYLIMKNGDTNIGLFQGMFEGQMLTFNPGWDNNAQNLEQFDDIRTIHQQLKDQGIEISSAQLDTDSGPANMMFSDPDGNIIFVDQHR